MSPLHLHHVMQEILKQSLHARKAKSCSKCPMTRHYKVCHSMCGPYGTVHTCCTNADCFAWHDIPLSSSLGPVADVPSAFLVRLWHEQGQLDKSKLAMQLQYAKWDVHAALLRCL